MIPSSFRLIGRITTYGNMSITSMGIREARRIRNKVRVVEK